MMNNMESSDQKPLINEHVEINIEHIVIKSENTQPVLGICDDTVIKQESLDQDSADPCYDDPDSVLKVAKHELCHNKSDIEHFGCKNLKREPCEAESSWSTDSTKTLGAPVSETFSTISIEIKREVTEPEETSKKDSNDIRDKLCKEPDGSQLVVEQDGSLTIVMKARNSQKKESKEQFSCKLCPYNCGRKRTLAIHMKVHTGDVHKCDQCPRKFTVKHKLNRHMLTHTGFKPFQCELCPYKCYEKNNLNTHIRTHTKEKIYACMQCPQRYTSQSNLIRHTKRHNGEKTYYYCDLCSHKCVDKSNLERHIRTHTGDKPFGCELCSYKCMDKSNLVRHMRSHTGEKPFACEVCPYKCAVKANLIIHMRAHTGEKPYSCEVCPYKCKTKSCLAQHMRHRHTGNKKCNTCKGKKVVAAKDTKHL